MMFATDLDLPNARGIVRDGEKTRSANNIEPRTIINVPTIRAVRTRGP